MFEHVWCALKHVVHVKEGDYYLMLNERSWGPFSLSGDELAEWEADFAEIDAFEAPLFAQGIIGNLQDIHEDMTLPDGPYSGMDTGYYITFKSDSSDPPAHLFHPLYAKWAERMKVHPNMYQYRDPFWVK
jgi:hypothetical protein